MHTRSPVTQVTVMPLKRSSSNTRPHVSPKHSSWKESRMSFLCLVSPQICSSGKSIKQNYNYSSKKNLLIKSQIIFLLLYLKMLACFSYFRRRGPHHLTTVACQEGFTGAGRERDSPDSSIRNRRKEPTDWTVTSRFMGDYVIGTGA